jgi:hypothetical protein
MMKKKWLLMLFTSLFAAFLVTGCNMDNDAPPEDTNDVEDNGGLNNNGNDTNGNDNDANLPGNDQDVENGPLGDGDDENDANPDQEDIIEEPQDTTDKDQKDE